MQRVIDVKMVHNMLIDMSFYRPPQWGAADAEIKVPSDENTELKGSL